MISARRRHLVFSLVMSCFMSLLMSAVITLINTGTGGGIVRAKRGDTGDNQCQCNPGRPHDAS